MLLQRPEIALVVLDLVMPGQHGTDTFNQIHEQYPGMPVIVVTGYDIEEMQERFEGAKPGPDALQALQPHPPCRCGPGVPVRRGYLTMQPAGHSVPSRAAPGRDRPTVNKPGLPRPTQRQEDASDVADDRELVARARNGDDEAFGALVQMYYQRVFNIARGFVSEPEEARDLAQQAWLKVWKKLDTFKGHSGFFTWLYRLVTFVCLDYLRMKKRRAETELPETLETHREAGSRTGPERRPQPGEGAGGGRDPAALRPGPRDAEPEPSGPPSSCARSTAFPTKEIARAMRCSKGTVMSRIFYARKNLQRSWRTCDEPWQGRTLAQSLPGRRTRRPAHRPVGATSWPTTRPCAPRPQAWRAGGERLRGPGRRGPATRPRAWGDVRTALARERAASRGTDRSPRFSARPAGPRLRWCCCWLRSGWAGAAARPRRRRSRLGGQPRKRSKWNGRRRNPRRVDHGVPRRGDGAHRDLAGRERRGCGGRTCGFVAASLVPGPLPPGADCARRPRTTVTLKAVMIYASDKPAPIDRTAGEHRVQAPQDLQVRALPPLRGGIARPRPAGFGDDPAGQRLRTGRAGFEGSSDGRIRAKVTWRKGERKLLHSHPAVGRRTPSVMGGAGHDDGTLVMVIQ